MNDGVAATNINNTYITNNNYADTDVSELSPEELIKAFIEKVMGQNGPGAEAASNAVANEFGQELVDSLNNAIAERDDIPDAQKDRISDVLEATLEANQLDTTAEAIAASEMIQEMIAEWAQEQVQDASDSTSGTEGGDGAEAGQDGAGAGGAEDKKESGGGESGNWLVALAKAMSSIAGDHLEQLINKQTRLGELQEQNEITKGKAESAGDGSQANALGAQAKEMTTLSAEMQAHAQMMKMMQETMTTVIKSIGEALNSTVRKQ